MTKTPRLYFVAAEASGDLLARETIEAVRARGRVVDVQGIGGAELTAIGIVSPIDISPLSVLGFAEGIRAYRDVVRLADAAADAIVRAMPDVVVLVDSWGFTLRVAQRVRARAPHIRLIKLIGPQVWATRPGRAKTLSATVDHLLAMHEMEAPFYAPFNLPVTVIGNPALARVKRGDGPGFRAKYSIAPNQSLVLVLPGSRRSEIKRVAPTLIEAALQLHAADPSRAIVIAPADHIQADFATQFPNLPEHVRVVSDARARYDAMAAATVSLSCSGTVTTEVAMQDCPQIIAYKTGWITWALARGFLFSRTHIALLNIVSDDTEIVPEFVQTKLKAEAIAAKIEMWLTDENLRLAQIEAQRKALARMGEGQRPAADIAAEIILREVADRSQN